MECVSIDMTEDAFRLPKDWLVRAHVGITASTGQLADNHDVISLASFSDASVLEEHVSLPPLCTCLLVVPSCSCPLV
jgi:hypothetical protein